MTDSEDTSSQKFGTPGSSEGLEPLAPDSEMVEPQLPVGPSPGTEMKPPAGGQEDRARLSPGAIFFGVVVSVGFLAWVLLGRVTVHPFDKIGRRMRVLDVWTRLHNHLPEVAHPTLLKVIFDVSIIMIVVGSFACIWLALLAAGAKDPGNQSHSSSAAEPPALQSER
jgi:hypothetical protein